jgi:hypothetical protein
MIGIIEYFHNLTGFDPTDEQVETLIDLTTDALKGLVLCYGRGFSKTLCAAIVTLWYAEKSLETTPIKIMLVSSQDTMWEYIEKYIAKSELLMVNRLYKGKYEEVPKEGFRLKNGTIVFTFPQTNKVRGNRADIVIIDESADCPREILNSASLCLTGANPNRIILLSTPHKEGLFTDIVRDPHAFGYLVKVKSSENLSWNKLTMERIKKMYSAKGMTKSEFKMEVLAQIPALTELNYFPRTHLTKCIQQVGCNRLFPNSSLEAGIDWGYDEPTVLTVTEKSHTQRKSIYQKSWRHKPIEELAPIIAEVLKGFEMAKFPNITKADKFPVEYKGCVERYYSDLHINYVNLSDHKQSALEQLQRRIRQQSIIIPSMLVDLIIQLRNYRLEMVRNDDLVISLALSCYEGNFITKETPSKVHFPKHFNLPGGHLGNREYSYY